MPGPGQDLAPIYVIILSSMSVAKHKQIKVAIVGRPNVGKSTLFNRLLKRRKSIVHDSPGVTRDRLYAEIDWNDRLITLIDTGGLYNLDDVATDKEIIKEVDKHVFLAIDEADFVVFLVDGKAGITYQDEKIAKRLRKIQNTKKIYLAVNKIDSEKQLDLVNEFYSLGLDEPIPISALAGSSGLAEILDDITHNSKTAKYNKDDEVINIAIVGKPNVGKSSILNCLTGKERSVVSSIAGTTRDSIDTKIKIADKTYVLIDTAGLRRKSKVSTMVERYATTRAIESIERAEVVLFVVSANEKISDQDQKIASVVKKRSKASIILVNKWDLIPDRTSLSMNKMRDEILSALHFVDYSNVLFISALEKKNTNKIFQFVDKSYQNFGSRISTGKLNKTIEDIVLMTSPPGKKGRFLRIYYATQANVYPPEVVFFVNDHDLVNKQYEKFLERGLRENFDLSGTPIKLVFRNKRKN